MGLFGLVSKKPVREGGEAGGGLLRQVAEHLWLAGRRQ